MIESLSRSQASLAAFLSQLAQLEAAQRTCRGESGKLGEELARCRAEYEAFEQKDIQYHENLKAQKANLRRMRDQRKRNVETVETKSAELERLEASLTEMQGNVETAQARREALEEELQKLLQAHKKELDALKEKRSEVEVETVEPSEGQTSMRPLQESVTKANAAQREKKTELDTWTARKERTEGEVAALREEIQKNRDSVGLTIVSHVQLEHKQAEFDRTSALLTQTVSPFSSFSRRNPSWPRSARGNPRLPPNPAPSTRSSAASATWFPFFPLFSVVPRAAARPLRRPLAFRGSVAAAGGARAGRGAGERGAAGPAGRPGDDRRAAGRGGEHGVRGAGQPGGGDRGGRAALRGVPEAARRGPRALPHPRQAPVLAFLALLSRRALQAAMEAPFQAPRGAERLFDRITAADPRVRCAFYFALRDTLVTDSLDAARAIAYRGDRADRSDRGDRSGRRVVTLDGMLIDSAGTMAGGGTAQRRGLMRLGDGRRTAGDGGEEVGETAVKKLEAEVARLSRECEEKGRERAELRVGKTAGIEG